MLLVGCGQQGQSEDKSKLKEISIDTQPTKLEYTVGDFFDPAGLKIKTLTYGGDESVVAYTTTDTDFSFTPSLETALAVTDTTVVVTYKSLTANITITVNEAVDTFAHTINFQNATTCKSSDNNFEDKFLPNFINDGTQLLINLQTTGMVQVVKNDQKIEYTSWSEKVLSIGNADGNGKLELTFKSKVVSVEIEARAHVKFYYYSDTQGISADSNSKLTVNGSYWTFPTPTLEEYETETKTFNINSNKVTLNTDDVANGRVTIFNITFNIEK